MKHRWFVVTNWNVTCDYEAVMKANNIRYVAYGEEKCPNTGRPHHQMFMYMQNQCSGTRRNCNKMGDWFGTTHCSVQPMRGKIEENEYYCSKESELVKIGDEPKQGCRADLDETKELIMKGDLTVDEVAVENPAMFHQYGRTLDRLEGIALRQRFRTEMTEGVWYTGPSGSGKSHECFRDFDPETHYVKNLNEEWWDGYKGQETVILNEFRGQIPFAELLDLMDKWPKNVKWRCRESVPFLAKRILIASIKRPEQVYVNQCGEPWEQFHRRCRVVTLLDQKCSEGNIGPSEPKKLRLK